MDRLCWGLLTLHWVAADKRIAFHAIGATAVGYVIEHLANSRGRTSAGTWIHALMTHTSKIAGAIRVQYTFWATANERISLVFGNTGALTIVTLGIGTTWRRVAWILRYWRCFN